MSCKNAYFDIQNYMRLCTKYVDCIGYLPDRIVEIFSCGEEFGEVTTSVFISDTNAPLAEEP